MKIRKKRFDELSPYKIIHHDFNRRYPIHVEIDPTSACQQNCLRCSYKQNIDGQRDYLIHQKGVSIPYSRFKDLIEEMRNLGVLAITLSGGGEPLVYPRIEDIISKILSENLKLGIITNLSVNMDPKLLSRAVWIRVSLDAATRDTYNTLHRPSNKKAFDLVLDNIQSLSALNTHLDLGVNFLIQPENRHEVLDAAKLVKEAGAKYIRFVPAIATESIDYNKILSEIRPDLLRSLDLIDDHFHVFVIEERFDALEGQEKSYSFCYKQEIHPLIGADGNVYPCCLLKYYDRHVLGSILEESFATVWEGPKRRAWLQNLNVDECPPCWFDKTNDFIEYVLTKNPKHMEFV
jgi:radical SAM protein with 4Fe4S-binding SPASM domain